MISHEIMKARFLWFYDFTKSLVFRLHPQNTNNIDLINLVEARHHQQICTQVWDLHDRTVLPPKLFHYDVGTTRILFAKQLHETRKQYIVKVHFCMIMKYDYDNNPCLCIYQFSDTVCKRWN